VSNLWVHYTLGIGRFKATTRRSRRKVGLSRQPRLQLGQLHVIAVNLIQRSGSVGLPVTGGDQRTMTESTSVSQFNRFQDTRLKIDDASSFDVPYVVMNTLATIVACYGLLADSPAVVIGAMIIAMLLGPISGVARGEYALAGGADATKLQLRAEAYNCWLPPCQTA
jgi:hypothetical protein